MPGPTGLDAHGAFATPEIIHLTLKQEYFAQIVNKQKHTEYRQQKPYWRKRFEGQKI